MAFITVFCFHFSIRLGAIIAGILTITQSLIPGLVMYLRGPDHLKSGVVDFLGHSGESDYESHTKFVLDMIEKHPSDALTIYFAVGGFLSFISLIEIFGAFMLKKWFLLPFIIFEGLRLVYSFYFHSLLMIILKRQINLGTLIAFSASGAFVILFFVYLWWCVVSLFHAITVINTSEYRSLYGDNPFATSSAAKAKMNNIKNVKKISSPDSTASKKLLRKRPQPSNVKFQPITISMNDKQNAPFYMDDYYPSRNNNRQNNRSLGYY